MPLLRFARTAALLAASVGAALALSACTVVERERPAREPATVVTPPPPQPGAAVVVPRAY
jgi:hypothetical protein